MMTLQVRQVGPLPFGSAMQSMQSMQSMQCGDDATWFESLYIITDYACRYEST